MQDSLNKFNAAIHPLFIKKEDKKRIVFLFEFSFWCIAHEKKNIALSIFLFNLLLKKKKKKENFVYW